MNANHTFSTLYSSAVCGLSGYAIFFSRCFINGTIFGKNQIACFDFPRLLSETLLILRIIQEDIVTNLHTMYIVIKVPIIVVRF
jgi:hypothetical protein